MGLTVAPCLTASKWWRVSRTRLQLPNTLLLLLKWLLCLYSVPLGCLEYPRYTDTPLPDNAAETEYIFMVFVEGIQLSNIWIVSITRQIAELESKCQLLSRLAEACTMQETWRMWPGIPLEDERFCVGPDTSVYVMAVDYTAHRSRTMYPSLKLTDNYR